MLRWCRPSVLPVWFPWGPTPMGTTPGSHRGHAGTTPAWRQGRQEGLVPEGRATRAQRLSVGKPRPEGSSPQGTADGPTWRPNSTVPDTVSTAIHPLVSRASAMWRCVLASAASVSSAPSCHWPRCSSMCSSELEACFTAPTSAGGAPRLCGNETSARLRSTFARLNPRPAAKSARRYLIGNSPAQR